MPLLLNEAKSFRSHLFFPGRVCTANYATETELGGNSLIVSDTGHHRIVVMSSEGNIKVICIYSLIIKEKVAEA